MVAHSLAKKAKILPHSSWWGSPPSWIAPALSIDRSNRSALFDSIEEGGIRAMFPPDVTEQDNDKALDGLHDRVNILKRLTGDIHDEAESHNRVLDRMGNDMDASRGILSGTVDRFKTVFKTKSSRKMFKLVSAFVVVFLVVYYVMKFI